MKTICCAAGAALCLLLLATGAAADPAPVQCKSSDGDLTRSGVGSCKVDTSKQSLPPLRYCMPDAALSCGNPNNKACRHCILLFEANDPAGVCAYSGAGPNKYCSKLAGSTIQIATAEANSGIKHWKVVPTTALKGVEDMANKPNMGDQFFQDGWYAAQKGSLPSAAGPIGLPTAAMAINSPYTRTDHQMHIHIASPKPGFGAANVPQTLAKFGNDWIVLDATKFHDKVMQCPTAGHTPKPFSAMSEAISKNKWPLTTGQGIKPWESTTLALIKPDFCKGGNTCDHCYLMLHHVGDRDILSY